MEHLLLVRDDAVRLLQDLPQVLVQVERLRTAVLHVDVARDLFQRTGAEEGDHGGELTDVLGLQLHHVPAHPCRLHLEDAEGVAVAQHVCRRGVAVRDLEQVHPLAAAVLDQRQRLLQDREVGQSQVVDLEQADLLDVPHRVLGRRHGGVGVRVLARRALQRHDVGERLRGDHHAGGVRGGVPGDALQLLRGVDKVAHGGISVVRLLELGRLPQRLRE